MTGELSHIRAQFPKSDHTKFELLNRKSEELQSLVQSLFNTSQREKKALKKTLKT